MAGIYGLCATLPLYLRAPPAGAALWYWGFAGAAAATQLLYLVIAFDPRRFRPAIPVGIASKLSFLVPALVLFVSGSVNIEILMFGAIDFALAIMFLAFFVMIPRFGR